MTITKTLVINNSNSVIGFGTWGDKVYPVWYRFITINGEKIYEIGNICDTCAFFFERVGGDAQSIRANELVENLNNGIDNLNDDLIYQLKTIIPNGNYVVTFSHVQPLLCIPGGESDYFSHEQAELWAVDYVQGAPHDPKTEYYRLATKELQIQILPRQTGFFESLMSRNSNVNPEPLCIGFFEFLVPLFPHKELNLQRVEKYRGTLLLGHQPTIVTLSVLDVKGPADWPDDLNPDVTEHWCLAHYLLDGHHKAYASALEGKPITMISFIATDYGVSTVMNVNWLLQNR